MTGNNGQHAVSAIRLPAGWTSAPIEAVVAPMETANPAKNGPGEFFYVDIDAVDNIANRIVSPKRLPRATPPSRARHVIRTNDVIISLVRPRLKNISIVPPELDAQWASTAFCVCRPRRGVDPRYLHYMFLQDKFLQAIKTYGDSPPSGHDDDLLATVIPVAPSPEQIRIADRIDELFTDLAAGVAALERVKRNLTRYRAAVLHAAVTGRLTEVWRKQHGPPAEPGPKLLERILAERRRQWERRTLARYQKDGKQPPKNWRDRYPEPSLPKPLVERTPFPPLPEGWCWAGVDQVGWVQLGRQRSPKNRSDKHPTKYIRAANITEDGLDLSDVLDMEFEPHELEAYRLVAGDLVLSEASGSAAQVGKPAVWRDELPDCAFQNTVVRLRPTIVCTDYMYAYFLYCYRSQVFARVAGGVGINHLSAEKFSRLPVSLPPLAEQTAIVEAVNEKLSQIDGLEAEVGRGLARASRLRQSILKAAFEGKLVPQDPSDEPSSVLLEKIARSVECEQVANREHSRKKVRPAIEASETHSHHRGQS